MTEKSKQRLEFIINIVYFLFIIGIVYFVFKYVLNLVFPFIVAFMLVAMLHPIIRFINKRLKINKKIVSVVIIVLLYAILGSGIFWLITQIFFLAKDAFTALPGYYESTLAPTLSNLINIVENFTMDFPLNWGLDMDTLKNSLMTGIQELGVAISQVGISVISSITNGIPSFFIGLTFTIMLSVFISIQYDKVVLFMKNQLPNKAKSILTDTRKIMANTILKYIKAYIILMLITFVELSIGLLILKIPNAIGIAAGVAVFDALPFFGTGAIMIPWIIIELVQANYSLAIGLAIVYGVITLIRNVIEPKVVGDQLGLNPIVSLMSIYLGYRIFGVLGMIVFPIIVQIVLALHKNGSFELYKANEE